MRPAPLQRSSIHSPYRAYRDSARGIRTRKCHLSYIPTFLTMFFLYDTIVPWDYL